MILILLLKSLSLACQCGVVLQVVALLRSPYQFPRWRVAWAWMLLATLAMVGARLVDFWQRPRHGDILFDLSMSLGVFLSLRALRSIFAVQLAPPALEPIAHVVIDQHSQILEWDAPAARLFGWTTTEAIGQTLLQTVIAPRDWEAHRAGVARYLADGETGRLLRRTYAANARCKDGSEIPVELTITPLQGADGTPHFAGQVRALVHL